MPNNYHEEVQRYAPQKVNQKPQLLTYILIGISIVIGIFTVVEVLSKPTNQPEVNEEAHLELRVKELDATIDKADRDRQVADLLKQATALELEAYKISEDD